MAFLRPFRNRKIGGVFLIVSGSICVVVGMIWEIYSYRFTSTALKANGHITQMVERRGDHGESFYPVFEYADRNGAEYTVYSSVGTYPSPYQVGDAVTVFYQVGAERNARLDDWFTLWGIPLFLLIAGAADLIVGAILLAWPRITARWVQLKESAGVDIVLPS